MKKLRNILACLIVSVLMLSMLAGCNEQEVKTTEGGELPYVKLKVYVVGNLPAQSDLVLDNLNKMLKEKINAELEITELSWGDYKNKYSLSLASGENIDMIYTSNWCYFLSESKKGAFMALNDLVQEYAPNAYADTPEEAWDCVRVGGEITMLPQHYSPMVSRAIAYREDLRKKYNVPEINSFDDLEVYFDAIKSNEPDMFPMHANIGDLENLYLAYMWQEEAVRITNLGDGVIVDINDQSAQLFPVYDAPSYKGWAEIARRWYEKGFWSRDVLSNKTASDTAFLNGTSASTCVQLSSGIFSRNSAEEDNPGWEVGSFMLEYEGKSRVNPYSQNGMAIPITSKNPERVLMAYDLLSTDKDFYYAHVYGIEDVTYKVNQDGTFAYPDTFVQGSGYSFGGLGLRMGMNNPKLNNDNLEKARDEYVKYEMDLDASEKYGLSGPVVMMLFDTDPFANELTSYMDVYKTYNNLLIVGADSTPIDTQLSNFKKAAESAGIQKILEQTNLQKDEYLSSKQ